MQPSRGMNAIPGTAVRATGSTTAPISVVIPAYNAAATLGRALDSVRAQTLRVAEVLVVDDGSADGTAELVRARGDLPVRLIAAGQRGGAARARNLGIAEARADYIAFLDADDEWSSDKLQKQLRVIEVNPAISFVACRSEEYAPDGQLLGLVHSGVPVVTGAEAWRALLAANFVSTPCVLARRSVLQAVGGFDPAFPIAEDQDLWIRLALAGEVGFVDEVLVRVHERPGSLSREYKPLEPDIALGMVLAHIERQRGRLTPAELRHALGARFAQNGRRLYASGRQRLRGLAYLWRAIANGHAVGENLWFMLTAAPGAAWLKATLLGRKA